LKLSYNKVIDKSVHLKVEGKLQLKLE